MLTLENASRIVTITEAGNILTPDGNSYVMDAGVVYLNYDNAAAKWRLNTTSSGDAVTSGTLAQFAATTSAELAGVISDETGSGLLVFGTSPTLVTPALGTPSALVATNATGTAASLTVGATTGVEAGADVTDATNVAAALTLTGDVTTSAGFATTIAAKAVHVSMLDDGTDGELITWDSAGLATTVPVGTATHILTSNGVGAEPTFQANAASAPEGTAVLSTGEVGGTKFLREDGDGTCSWITISGGGDALVVNPLSQFAATTSLQLLGVISDETGTGALVFATSPTLVTPALGTPASGVMTNMTGLPVTGLANGTDGELITWSAAGVAETVAVGTSSQVLTSNGAGAAPTFQAAGGGGSTLDIYTGVVISEQVMASSGNIPDFTSIPSGYDKLELEYFAKMNSASPAEIHLGINADLTSTNYHRQALGADNGAVNNAEAANSTITYIGDNSADSFSTGVITMYDYDNTTDPKQFSTNFSVSVNTTQLSIGIRTIHWNTTSAAVSRIRLDDAISMAGNGFLIGSTFRLVGYKTVTVNIP